MAFANLNDINAHLPTDKIRASEASANLVELDADRIIRGQVGGVVEFADIQLWVDPEGTPEIIRAIAGRLIAAAIYAKALAENSELIPYYAQNLYNQAMKELEMIRTGQMIIINPDGTTLETRSFAFSDEDFRPNDESPTNAIFKIGQAFS